MAVQGSPKVCLLYVSVGVCVCVCVCVNLCVSVYVAFGRVNYVQSLLQSLKDGVLQSSLSPPSLPLS